MLIFKEDIVLNGYTCIVPSLGVGNVSQLSTDLIISTLKLKQVATGFHKALIPIFGPSAFQHEPDSFTNALNVYIDSSKKLLAFQIRSPLIGKHTKDFLNNLVEFLKKSQVSKIFADHKKEFSASSSPKFSLVKISQRYGSVVNK
uniref:Proteasome assembly chaperone 2 n=1 Tax=Megaselia scalaris TaxID=36166 RepID=T1GBQ8_MEGSC